MCQDTHQNIAGRLAPPWASFPKVPVVRITARVPELPFPRRYLGQALGSLALRLIVPGADSPGQRSRTAGNAAENELRWGAEAGFTCRYSGKHVHVQGLMARVTTERFVAEMI